MVSGIPNIIKDLSDDLKARVEAVIQLTEQREELDTKLAIAKRDLRRVQIALEALNGNAIPLPPVVDDTPGDLVPLPSEVPPSRPVLPAPSQVVEDSRPLCNSCGSGRMNYTSRTLKNGKTVTLWLCSECRNERF